MIVHDNILFYEPQPKARDFRIQGDQIRYIAYWNTTIYSHSLPPGEWEIVGRFKELTEDQWRKAVKSFYRYFPEKYLVYVNYEKEVKMTNFGISQEWNAPFGTAIESGFSLLRSHGIDPESNPLILVKEKEGV